VPEAGVEAVGADVAIRRNQIAVRLAASTGSTVGECQRAKHYWDAVQLRVFGVVRGLGYFRSVIRPRLRHPVRGGARVVQR
jgi:hypothetical protein